MKVSLRTSFTAFALASALAGVAAPAFANGYYQGIDPHHPPGTQNRGTVFVPMESPYYIETMPAGSIYVDRMPTGSIYVDPMATGSVSGAPGRVREHYTNEYQGGGQGDYYQGILPPAPVP